MGTIGEYMGIIDTTDTCCVDAMAEAESIEVADVLETTQTSPSISSRGSSYSIISISNHLFVAVLFLLCSCSVLAKLMFDM